MGIMGLFFLIAPILDETGEADFLYAIAIILLLLFINHILTARKHISKLENWFIENDGFLWSHQQYPS